MALPRIFDQRSFKGQGALISTRALFGGLTKPPIDLTDVPKLVFLRWQLNPRIGMPVEPFKVWRRPAMPLEEPKVQVQVIAVPPLGFVVTLPEPMVSVTVGLQAGAAGAWGNVLPLADGIGFENVLAVLPYTLASNGSTILRFQANYITGFFVLGGASVAAVSGFPLAAAEKIGGWELVETVGLPVDEGQWADLAPQTHGIKQGLVGTEVAAPDAAAQRMSRGINPFGWYQAYPIGQLAPKWDLPGAADLIKDANAQLLPILHKAMFLPAGDQADFTSDFAIDPPQNPAGQKMSGAPGKATVAPLTLLQMAVSTDPLQAVTLGFGTGYQYEDIPPINLRSMSLFNDKSVSDWDFMVTGQWRKGEGNAAKDVEYAALIRRPRLVLPPPAPADLALDFLGHHQPMVPDAAWTASVRLSWERLELDNLTRVASFAAARFDQAQPGTPATALMERRATAPGHHFIGDTQNPDDPEQVRQSASDSAYPIPNAPGSVSALYGVSTQNIFGIWSPWETVPFNNSQPAPDLVQIVDASLVPTDPGPPATVCATELRMEFVLDWRARRVGSVTFRGRLFAAATRFDDPPAGMPGNLQTSLAGASRNLTVTFAGDVPSVTGATIQALNDQGSAVVAPGSAQGTSRRYRMTVPGFALDFAATSHVGLALQGRLQESLAPARLSAWSPSKLAYGSDPRARPAPPLPGVPLTSLPDAAGEGHARLHWTALPGAAGYVVYTSNEFVILDRTGQPRAAPEATLSERLVAMNAAFNADPDRNAFTRVNDTPLTATTLDVTIPRGSQAIHAWLVLALSAGGVEGPWPGAAVPSDALIVYAAPKIAQPAPPRIEVRRIAQGAGFAARVRVETRKDSGARPKRIRLYRTRVADAARAVDSMGLPLAEIAGSAGPWITTPAAPTPDGWIDTATGTDAPDGSWKYVWYRAEALADPLPQRGVLGGRSLASPAVPVVVPPPGPPPLSALVLSWPGGAPGDVLAVFSTDVPVGETPLGSHMFEVEALEQGQASPLMRARLKLAEVSASAPGATESGLWRTAPGQYSVLLRRADVNDAASLTVRLIDPIGRSSERVAAIDAGSLLTPPVMSPISSFVIAGRGKVYTFTMENVRDDTINGQPWRLQIELTPDPASPIPPAGPGRPLRTQFRLVNGIWVYAAPVASIPVTALNETFTAVRQRVGDVLTVSILAKAKLKGVSAVVTAPDGATAGRKARG
jgi:hypothetical protein